MAYLAKHDCALVAIRVRSRGVMIIIRRFIAALVLFCALAATPSVALAGAMAPEEVLRSWYKTVLELVRHTPTYSPPVASRSFAYLGVIAYETAVADLGSLRTMAGQLNGLTESPQRETGKAYDEAVVMQSAMAFAVKALFGNTGPTGQRAMAAVEKKLAARVSEGVAPDVALRSEAYGRAVAGHILKWSQDDGGAVIENMGFPLEYQLIAGPAHWVPTSTIAVQQFPLLPDWGKNRPFAMPSGKACPLPPPPAYSEDKASAFYRQALEVYETTKKLSDEQRIIARFWSDDPMLSPTPPGHWISIALEILDRDSSDLATSVDALMRLSVAIADGFIGCWDTKYQYDLLRPVTYIRRVIDAKWEPLLITPPFPEYPSGHSTQSGAATTVLTAIFGEDFAFTDATHERDGLAPRRFPDFWTAAREAGISRLYGGIHFRAAVDQGLEQGRCIGEHVNALRTRK